MKALTLKRCFSMLYIILCIGTTFCALSCQSVEQDTERIMQNNVQCKTVIQAKWGNNPGELGYAPDDQTIFCPRKPFRFQIDTTGNIYVADLYNERILQFTPGGEFLRTFNVPTFGETECIVDVAVGGDRIAVATTDHIYVFDQSGGPLLIPEWPADAGQYGFCSEDMASRKVEADKEGNIYACGWEKGTENKIIVQFDRNGQSRKFFVGDFDHFVVGWDGSIYIEHLNYTGTIEKPADSLVFRFDSRANQLGKIIIRGRDLVNAGLLSPGLLVAVDANGNLYGSVVNILQDGNVVPQEALVQISPQGRVLRVIKRGEFIRPATDVVDREGNFYLWHFTNVPSGSVEIWRCSP